MMVDGGGQGWILHLPVSDDLTADGRAGVNPAGLSGRRLLRLT